MKQILEWKGNQLWRLKRKKQESHLDAESTRVDLRWPGISKTLLGKMNYKYILSEIRKQGRNAKRKGEKKEGIDSGSFL